MGKNRASGTITIRLPHEDIQFLTDLAAKHDLSRNAMLASFIQGRIKEVREEGD